MLVLRKSTAIFGIAMSALCSIFCPFLKVPIKGNWNLYETDSSLFFITVGIWGVLVLLFVLRKISFFRFTAVIYLLWIILGLIAVYFKINNYFGMELVDGLLSKTLHIKWGWAALILSAIIIIFSVKKVKGDIIA